MQTDIDNPSHRGDKLRETLDNLSANIESLTVIISHGFQLVSLFDYGDTRFNGYRSMFKIIKRCLARVTHALQKLAGVLTMK